MEEVEGVDDNFLGTLKETVRGINEFRVASRVSISFLGQTRISVSLVNFMELIS